jgi:murein DD-endopeptidase MepM/ murein hydrolase activator NlpD
MLQEVRHRLAVRALMSILHLSGPGLPVQIILNLCCLAGLLVASTAAAQQPARPQSQIITPLTAPSVGHEPVAEMKVPTISDASVDWSAVRAALADIDPTPLSDHANNAPAIDSLTRLNAETATIFPNITVSPIPVLLPFDTGVFLRDAAHGAAADVGAYFSGFNASRFFFPGPSGYDATLSLSPTESPGMGLTFARPVDVQISGSALLYELDGPVVSDGVPVPELETDFPGIRRVLLESHVRYTFARFGVPYVVSLMCFDGAKSAHRLSCREADKVAVRFLKALHVVGGMPQSKPPVSTIQTIDRPKADSPDFTYYAPGDILPGTGMHGQNGRADSTVYAKIRFPMAQAPAYANSQSFMNWGDCDHSGRVSLGGGDYRCSVNLWLLVPDESKNYAYPWRDNFCEHRYYYVGQCPAGLGHQGQDIRPASCHSRVNNDGRCAPYQHDVVAVRDGIVMRAPGDRALYLVVDSPGEHLRFRYLHMDPQMLDAAGMVSGRAVSEGEVIGAVGNYGRRAGGTTYHLHFDVQVPTRQGWVFVNPYMTLVAAYERLIGGRGHMISAPRASAAGDDHAAAPPMQDNALPDGKPVPNSAAMSTAKASPDANVAPNILAESPVEASPNPRSERNSERETAGAEHCKTRIVKGHRGRRCGPDAAARRAGATHAHSVRSVGRRVSHEGHGARHHGRDLRTRHARGTSRHGRA